MTHTHSLPPGYGEAPRDGETSQGAVKARRFPFQRQFSTPDRKLSNWVFIPIEGKVPRVKGWPNHPGLSPEEVSARLAASQNVGVITGERSCRLLCQTQSIETRPSHG